MAALIELKNLTFQYDHKPILDMPNWQVNPTEHVLLQGPSGSGKTTLLNILTGFLPQYQGSVSVLGQELKQLSPRKRDKLRGQHIGVIFQQLNLVPFLSVEDNIRLASYFAKIQVPDLQEKIADLIEQLHLPKSVLSQHAASLSVGQQQRVAIARALINHPELLIADEPTSALDHDARDAFIKTLFEVAEQAKTTVVMVSHDPSLAKHFQHNVRIQDINHVSSEVSSC